MQNDRRMIKKVYAFVLVAICAFVLAACSGTAPDTNVNNGQSVVDLFSPLVPNEPTATKEPESTSPQLINMPSNAPESGEPSPTGSVTETTDTPSLINTPLINITTSTALPTGASPAPSPSAQATASVYKLGSRGDEVKKIQQKLKELGYLKGSIDGVFGKATEEALKAFQSRNGLTSDGAAGRATLSKLYSSTAKKALVATATPKPTAKPTATPKISEHIYLRLGDSGKDVTRMQNRLIELGYLTGKATGKFDSATESAVTAFQNRNVSYSDGVAGPLTLKALYSSNAKKATGSAGVVGTSLKKGIENSEAVRTMQRKLKALGYYDGEIDGDFGNATENAVKAFQSNNGLPSDGVAGSQTLSVLYSNSARKANGSSSSVITPAPTVTPISTYMNVTPAPGGQYVTLRPGHSGTLVTNLQQALKDKGFFTGSVDGKYGPSTADAVTRFQRQNGLSQDGVAGAATQRVLFEGNFPAGS